MNHRSRSLPPSHSPFSSAPGRRASSGPSTGPKLGLAAALVFGIGLLAVPAAHAQEAGSGEGLPEIAEKTRGMEAMEGFFDLYWDDSSGRLYLEVDRWREPFLYQISLATGLGSNPVGLDRGQLGGTHVVEARRVGPRVLLVGQNLRYRARGGTPAEEAAVREAFAPSTLWGFDAVARTGDRMLVDATDFFLRDAHGVARQLKERGQGSFTLAGDRSTIHLERTRAFPENVEVESWLTFTSDDPGALVRRTAATGDAVSLRQHHSLVQLPDTTGYEPRPVDPRVGAFSYTFQDYATPIDQEIEVRWATRHRLHSSEPGADPAEPVEPIVYYVDPGIPEPIRGAVIEGASWWEEAFREAGYRDAFRVEILPEDVDPMDLRYNVIHWTHRRTRGWSYGSSVVDPRTGEILKGNVNLGSLRLRQDWLLAAGLGPPFASSAREGVPGSGARSNAPAAYCDLAAGPAFGYLATVADSTTPSELALARIRQLSAHEVGHTLGLAHNFIASTYGRASVMDYPAPLVRIAEDGSLDLSDAYDTGIGEYDRFAVNWLYRDVPDDVDEGRALEEIVRQGLERGYRFISDADARPAGAAHPLAALWDNGSDPVAALRHEMEVRERAMESFGPAAVRRGEALAALEHVLVPLYLHHRYQLEAAAHTLGGVDYSYAVRGDGQMPRSVVPADRQREALETLLSTLRPDFLRVPDRVVDMIPPRSFGMPSGETFSKRTAPVLDPLGMAASSARFTLDFLLEPERLARAAEQNAADPEIPGVRDVARGIVEATWGAELPDGGRDRAVARTVRQVALDALLEAAASPEQTELVRAAVEAEVDRLAERLDERVVDGATSTEAAALRRIRRWQERPFEDRPPAPVPELPPGSPIGGGG